MIQLNKREKILAAVAGVVVLLLAGYLLLGVGGPSLGRLRADRDRLADETQKKRARIAAARRATADLAEWNRRSLPADPANARSLYQNWLRELADQAGLHQLSIESSEGQSQRNVYKFFSFTVRGRAGLGSLTQFLYEFYSVGHLHQIRRLDIKSIEGASDLDVTMTVEALSRPLRRSLCRRAMLPRRTTALRMSLRL